MQRVLDYYEHYSNKGGEDKLVYTPEEAFAKCVRRWPDANLRLLYFSQGEISSSSGLLPVFYLY